MARKKEMNNRLSDGRTIRALEGTFDQWQMFGLHKSGLYNPAAEKIMSVKDHDDSINKSKVWKSIDNETSCWRTCRFGAYRRGFEKEDMPVGDKLVYIEYGVHTLEIPDVPVAILMPNGKSKIIGLRAAKGMIDFALEKLQYDPETKIVCVTSDFNPQRDVTVRDIMRPTDWALVDDDGYPLRSKPSSGDNSAARYSHIRVSDSFYERETTGWFGSISCHLHSFCFWDTRGVYAWQKWIERSEVALVNSRPKIRFGETNGQHPYRDAPRVVEGSESSILSSGSENEAGILKRLSLALGFG